MPGILPALSHSPLAQSPMICMPAWPLMTMAVARFQSRPGKLGSTMPRICAQLVERLLHGVGAERRRVELDERLLVEVGAAGAEHGAVEDGRVLPGLAAMRDAG